MILQLIENPSVATEVVALVDMHDDLSLWINCLDGIVTSGDVGREVGGVLGASTCDIHVIVIPQHTVTSLVSYLYPLHVADTSILQGFQHLGSMTRYGLLHLLESITLPSGRYCLMSRVCPSIRVMEVDHEAEAQLLCSPSLGHDIVLVAQTAIWIYPDTKADGVDTEVTKQRQALLLLATGAIEVDTVALHLREPTDIGSLGETTHIVSFLLFRSRVIIVAATGSRDREQEC